MTNSHINNDTERSFCGDTGTFLTFDLCRSFVDGRVFGALLNSVDPGCFRYQDLDVPNREDALAVVFRRIEDVMDVGQALQPNIFNSIPIDEVLILHLVSF